MIDHFDPIKLMVDEEVKNHHQAPVYPPKSNEPTQYHCHDSCNACGGVNIYQVISTDGGHLSECKTECKECGHKDYWAYGFFESSQEMEIKCNKYSFGVRG